MKTKLLRDLVCIEPINEAELETKGFILPSYASNVLPFRGIIKGVGPKVREVKVGQTAIFDRYRADNRGDKMGNKKLLYMPEEYILAIYE